MDVFEKTQLLNELFSRYQSLLTDKQVEYFKMYYHMDHSLQEIAEQFDVSRNAIYDQLRNVEKHLHNYEDKLKLNEIRIERRKIINELEKSSDINLIKKLRKLDE